jgi:hypothetical protein
LQVDQGLGIGTKAPLFNRATAQLTRFLQLTKPKANSKSPPVSLVLHARAGNCTGDLPAYDAFLLGGPHSGACRAACLVWQCAVGPAAGTLCWVLVGHCTCVALLVPANRAWVVAGKFYAPSRHMPDWMLMNSVNAREGTCTLRLRCQGGALHLIAPGS